MFIEVTPEEKARIEKQGWTPSEGVDPSAMIVPHGATFRLGHRADGACVFLDGSKCRIHSRFGEAAKPRACRLFPLAFQPCGNKLLAGLRFSCPSAAANAGPPLTGQTAELRVLAGLVVPENFGDIPAPSIAGNAPLDWPDFLRFVSRLDDILVQCQPLAAGLRACLRWLALIRSAQFDQITGPEANDILAALTKSAIEEARKRPGPPTGLGWMLFRSHLSNYIRTDTVADINASPRRRLVLLLNLVRFVAGLKVALDGQDRPIVWTETLGSFGPVPADAEAILTRFFRFKIQTLHFCGSGYYGMSLMEGFWHLALLYPVILWLARRQALSEGRRNIAAPDILRAIQLADHPHGYSPALDRAAARRIVRILHHRGEIQRLGALFSE